jgi:GH35 family endo-1,4-beta-xylanase
MKRSQEITMLKKTDTKIIVILTIGFLLDLLFVQQIIHAAAHPNFIFSKDIKAKFNKKINAVRKATFTIKFLDKNGNPVTHAGIDIQQKKHEFIFGGTISTPLFDKRKHKKKKEKILKRADEMFNMVVDANGFKWKKIEPKRGKTKYGFYMHNLSTQWAKEHNKEVRHHCLFWSNPKNNPAWLARISKTEVQKAIDNRIRYTKQRMGKDIKSLDVINEMLYFKFYRDVLGQGIIKSIFEKSKKAFPDARLYLNENPLQSGKAYLGFQHYKQLIILLKQHRIPFNGIGLQAHFDEQGFRTAKINPTEFILKWNDLIVDISETAGLPVLITEYDMKTNDENLRANFLEAFYLMAFSNKNVEGIVAWEWFDEKSKRALVRRDGSLTKAGRRYYDLVYGKWWTKTSTTTDENGIIKIDVYYGDYEITIEKNKVKQSFPLVLRKEYPRTVTLKKLQFGP